MALLRSLVTLLTVFAVLVAAKVIASGQQREKTPAPIGVAAVPLPDHPVVMDTAEQHAVRVVVVTRGLSHPWSLAFLPNGDMLVTERAGRLRIIRNGVLDSRPVDGLPTIHAVRGSGLLDLALHPDFVANRFVYLTYSKPGDKGVRIALARGKWNGTSLVETRDLFVGDAWRPGTDTPDYENMTGGSRIAFGRDGTLFMTTSAWIAGDDRAQQPSSLAGKVLRLRDDGTVPADNPFVGKSAYKPEIYSLGHRDSLGLIVHPMTGAVWQHENGPNGGDEVNIILPGRNYGWPLVSYGRWYEGPRVTEIPWREGFEQPLVFWVPSIAPSGMMVYTGDQFPNWKGNVFVGGLRHGEIPRTGQLVRIVFNEKQEELRRESLLTELRQRIRDVRQGTDGLIYLLTEEDEAALLRIEPAPAR